MLYIAVTPPENHAIGGYCRNISITLTTAIAGVNDGHLRTASAHNL
jgi:hypothetical protein